VAFSSALTIKLEVGGWLKHSWAVWAAAATLKNVLFFLFDDFFFFQTFKTLHLLFFAKLVFV
jgi:hypothetical protein